jgi:DNA polymerase-3 subunit epsilon
MKIAQQITSIETIETAGELGALFLESALIKEKQPMYNRQLRQARKLTILKQIEQEGYLTGHLETLDSISADLSHNILGIFTSVKQAKETLRDLARKHSLCPKVLGLESSGSSCFSYHLGWCRGACVKKEKSIAYNMRFTEAFSRLRVKKWPFKGPIAIREKGLKGREEAVVVDRWCVLGRVKNDADGFENIIANDLVFDVDAYKILRRYLSQSVNLKNVSLLRIQSSDYAFSSI